MKLSYVIAALEEFAPRTLQEAWDNSGLQIGLPDGSDECTGAILCVDVTEDTVAEAVERGCNLIVSHHPLIFKGLKALTGANPVQRAAMAAIRAGVAIYSAHTSLDSTVGGVSYAMAALMGARVNGVLSAADVKMSRLSVICPRTVAEDVRMVLLDGGAGAAPCAGNIESEGSTDAADSRITYSDVEGETLDAVQPDPIAGLSISHTPLTRVEAIVPAWRVAALSSAVASVPGAEDVRIETTPVGGGANATVGLGVMAEYDSPVTMASFADRLKQAFNLSVIRTSLAYEPEATVRRVAFCGGAGGEFIGVAASAGADAYVTADVRYHDFCDNRSGMAIFDIGHFESEACSMAIFASILDGKIPVYISQSQKNPVKYII